jgi:hypothetical protein
MKLSMVSGTAFVDFGVASSLTPYFGDKLTITDSAGHHLTGWIKAVGTGETYGGQLLSNATFTTTAGLNAFGTTIVATTSGCFSAHCLQITYTTNGQVWNPFTVAKGTLLKSSLYGKVGTADFLAMVIQEAGGTYEQIQNFYYNGAWTNGTIYPTTDLTDTAWWQTYQMGFSSPMVSYVDTASVQQVLTPSMTGVTIVSAAGGSTYNWTSEDSGFNRNDSGGYTYSLSAT